MYFTVGVLNLHLILPGCRSLKEKRSRIKPLLARLHREFNLSTAEIGHQDNWQETQVACAMISNDKIYNQKVFQEVIQFIENHFPDMQLTEHKIEHI